MRQRHLRQLLKRLKELRARKRLRRDELLIKLGEAKSKAGAPIIWSISKCPNRERR